MSTLKELNFKLILDDTEFNNKIATITQKSKELNTTLSNLLSISAREINKNALNNAKLQNRLADENHRSQEAQRRETEKTLALQQRLTEQLRREKDVTDQIVQRQKDKTASNNIINQQNQQAAAARSQQAIQRASAQTAINTQRITEATARAEAANVRLRTAQEYLNKALGKSTNHYNTHSRLLKQLVSYAGMYFSVQGAVSLVKNLVRVSAEFEKQRIALRAILGDLEGADHIFNKIKDLAVESPFAFKELVSYTKQLSAYSIPMEELYDTTKMLADVSAGLGVGMDRLVLAYGQIRSASFLRGQEVRQLTEAGIPILQELAKTFTQIEGRAVGVGEVFDKISSRQVTFEMVEDVFKNMTSEGGKFYQMQEVLAETLSGKLSNLKDAYEIMFSEIGDKNSGFLNNTVDGLRNLITNYEKVGSVLKVLIKTYGIYKATMLAVNAVMKTYKFFAEINATMAAAQRFNVQLNVLGVTAKKLGITMKTAFSVGLGAIILIGTTIAEVIRKSHELEKALKGITDEKMMNANNLVNNFEKLYKELERCTEGSENYSKVIAKINSQYGDYLPKLLTEKNALNDLKEAYDSVTASIYAKARASAEEEGLAEIYKNNNKNFSSYVKAIKDYFLSKDISEESIDAFLSLYRKKLLESSDSYSDILDAMMPEFFGEDSMINQFRPYALFKDFSSVIRKTEKDVKEFQQSMTQLFGSKTSFTTAEEAEAVASILERYNKRMQEIMDTPMSVKERNAQKKAAEETRLKDLIAFYTKQGIIIRKGEDEIKTEEDKSNYARVRYNQERVNYYRNLLKELQKVKDGWRAVVQKVLEKDNNEKFAMQWEAKDTDESAAYLEKLGKEYKDVKEKLHDYNESSVFSKDIENYKEQLRVIKEIAAALGVTLEDLASTAKKNTGKDPRITALENQADAIKALQDAYKELAEYLNDGQVRKALKMLFPEFANDESMANLFNLDFSSILGDNTATSALQEIIDDLKKLGDAGEEAADKLAESVGKKDARTWSESLQNYIKYRDDLQKWLDKDFNLKGSGLTLDISKIIADMTTDNNEVDTAKKGLADTLQKAMSDPEVKGLILELFGRDFWDNFIENGASALDELAEKEKAYNRKVAQEKIDDLASKYITEMYRANGIVLNDWSDKSLAQVRDLLEKLENERGNLSASALDLSDKEVAELEKKGIGVTKLLQQIDRLLAVDINNTSEEEAKKISSRVKDVTKSISGVISELDKLADGSRFSSLISQLGVLVNMFDKLSDNLTFEKMTFKGQEITTLKGDITTTILSAMTDYVNSVISAIAYTKELKSTIASAAIEGERLAAASALSSGVDTLFGENLSRKIDNAVFNLNKYKALVEADAAATEKTMVYARTTFGKVLDSGVLGASAFGSIQYIDGVMKFFDKSFGSKRASLSSLATSVGGELINEYGVLNADTLQRILDTYKDLSKAESEWIKEAIKNSEAYTEAMKQLEDSVQSLVGDVSSSFADAIIEQWKSMGNAAADYSDILGDVASAYAKMLIQSTLLEDVFDDTFKDEVLNLTKTKNASGVLALFDQKVSELEEYYPTFVEILEGLSQYLTNESDSSSISEGIKSVTEETANLLASYLNAIRADVSFNKVQIQGISTDVKQILGLLPSSPTLNDYLMQIQANTLNTAESTREILGELRSVMGIGAEGSAIKVLM